MSLSYLRQRRAVVPKEPTPILSNAPDKLSLSSDEKSIYDRIWDILQQSHLNWWLAATVCFIICLIFNLDYHDSPYDEIDSRNGLTQAQLTKILESNTKLLKYPEIERLCLHNDGHFDHGVFGLLFFYFMEIVMHVVFGFLFYLIECIWDKYGCGNVFTNKWKWQNGWLFKTLIFILTVIFNHVLRYWMIFIKLYFDYFLSTGHDHDDTTDDDDTTMFLYTEEHAINIGNVWNTWGVLGVLGAVGNQLKEFVTIFVRVHPKSCWMIRLSHGINYIILIYGTFQKRPSHMCLVIGLSAITGIYFIGDIVHQLHGDKQIKCAREGFIIQTGFQSLYIATFRRMFAPYVNVVCLATDCKNFIS